MPDMGKARPGILRVGFSFGIAPDGSPGTYNEQIAKRQILDTKEPASQVLVVNQWEIADAVTALDGEWASKNLKDRNIAKMRLLTTDDLDPAVLRSYQADPNKVPPEIADQIERQAKLLGVTAGQIWCNRKSITGHLNRILMDPDFSGRFTSARGLIKDLQRIGGESLTVEERAIPTATPGRFQSWRVNRLILEALLGGLVREGRYLNTTEVAELAVKRGLEADPIPEKVWIYAHPEHAPRCRATLLETAWRMGWNLDPEQAFDRNQCDPVWSWNPLWWRCCAQHWCRSKDDFEIYDRLMRAWWAGRDSL